MPLPLLAIGLELAKLAAPWIAEKVAGQKGEEVAKVLVSTAEAVTGKSGDEALDALKADPNLVLQYRSRILSEETTRINAILADVQDARSTMAKLAGMGSSLAWGAAIVSALVVIANMVMGYFIFTDAIPGQNKDLAMLYAGSLLAALGGVIAFWTGSSYGSIQKTDALIRK
jgi:hypothetical protein